MASCQLNKMHSKTEIKAMFNHCDKDKRKEQDHNNVNIDKNLTDENLQLRSLDETKKRFDDRLSWLDKQPNANKRKDRVLCVSFDVPVPAGFNATPENVKKFFDIVNEEYADKYGEDNIINSYMHVDEVHRYTHAEKTRAIRKKAKKTFGEVFKAGDIKASSHIYVVDGDEHIPFNHYYAHAEIHADQLCYETESRQHVQIYLTPVIDDKLNGKKFTERANLKDLNNRIHKRCQETFNLDFMDGTKAKSKNDVEYLKGVSDNLTNKAYRKSLEMQKLNLDYQKMSFLNEKEKYELEYKSRKKKLDDKERELNEREKAQNQRESDLSKKEDIILQQEIKIAENLQNSSNLLKKTQEYHNSGLEEYAKQFKDSQGVSFFERYLTYRESRKKSLQQDVNKAVESALERNSTRQQAKQAEERKKALDDELKRILAQIAENERKEKEEDDDYSVRYR